MAAEIVAQTSVTDLNWICGNDICEAAGETAENCPLDCSATRTSEIMMSPTVSTDPAAGLIGPDGVQFFAGSSETRLSLTDGNALPVIPQVRVKVYLPDVSIRKPIGDVALSVGATTYRLLPTGSYTGYFVTPSDVGNHGMALTVDYVDGSQDIVEFRLQVRPPGVIYETVDGIVAPISGARVTLIAQDGNAIALWDSETGNQRNPTLAGADGDYAFLVTSGSYKLQVSKDGYAIRDTLLSPFVNVVDAHVEMVRLPPPVEDIQDVPAAMVFATKVAIVNAKEFIDNAFVEEAAREDAPVIAAIAVANTAAAGAAAATAFPYLLNLYSFLAHPTALLARRKRKSWGVVYDALAKLPIDLAIVRLIDETTGRVIRSAVTDKAGRYFFIVPPGTYRMSAIKAGFTHPSSLLKGVVQDGKYVDLAMDGTVVVGPDGVIARNIPMDPTGVEKTPAKIVATNIGKRTQRAVAVLAIIGAAFPVIIVPSATVVAFLVLNIGSYVLLRRLAQSRKPKNWGSVRDKKTGRPIANVIARVFDTKYNKLLETQVTDLTGRYAFLVGPNSYSITFEKAGYVRQQKTPIDLTTTAQERGEFIAFDIKLEKAPEDTKSANDGQRPSLIVPPPPRQDSGAADLVSKIMVEEDGDEKTTR